MRSRLADIHSRRLEAQRDMLVLIRPGIKRAALRRISPSDDPETMFSNFRPVLQQFLAVLLNPRFEGAVVIVALTPDVRFRHENRTEVRVRGKLIHAGGLSGDPE